MAVALTFCSGVFLFDMSVDAYVHIYIHIYICAVCMCMSLFIVGKINKYSVGKKVEVWGYNITADHYLPDSMSS